MQQAKRPDGHAIPEHLAQHAVATILLPPQSVPVLDSGAPAAEVARPRSDVVIDADIISQDLASPAIVVARDHQDRDATLPEIRQSGEHAEGAARHDVPPFEPELEEIAVDDQRSRPTREMPQELHQRALDVTGGETEVRVGHHISWGGEHAHILAAPCVPDKG